MKLGCIGFYKPAPPPPHTHIRIYTHTYPHTHTHTHTHTHGTRYSSVVRAFAHGAMGRRIDPSWGEPIELFLVPASAPRLV